MKIEILVVIDENGEWEASRGWCDCEHQSLLSRLNGLNRKAYIVTADVPVPPRCKLVEIPGEAREVKP